MPFDITRLKEASSNLYYLSEGDYLFDVIFLDASPNNLQQKLLSLYSKTNDTTFRVDTLSHFFRNLTKQHPEETAGQKGLRQRYERLEQVLQEELSDVAVYLIGDVEVDAFILGSIGDDSYAGLRTKLIQT